ncbi:hypothetical protein ES288_D03G192600v1 [Gossypium darwinii]|uniref:NB-ARC domain-containing protein n=1 Tax=Gossypium darwinii TaxID=34276 RepID=A0A5D2D693_GOSDA|nr:hypothetical protein ES288_D03G192600v1 [Gossypium darwinii]
MFELINQLYQVCKFWLKIIKSATGRECKDMNKEELHKVLQDCLNAKRIFMVLDNVWNEDKKKWSELKDLLCGGAQGSRIIVTTRSRKVATITGTIPPYDLEHLSYDDCLSLFLKLLQPTYLVFFKEKHPASQILFSTFTKC